MLRAPEGPAPVGWPIMCHDLKQAWLAADLTDDDLPSTVGYAHNDAWWNLLVWQRLKDSQDV